MRWHVRSWWRERPAEVALVAVLFLATLVRATALARESLWLDEVFAVDHSALPLRELVSRTAADYHPPLHGALLHFWMALAGRSELAIRAPSVVFGVAAVALLFRTTSRLVGPASALTAALFLALSPVEVRYSQDATQYAFVSFLALLSMHAYVRWCRERSGALAVLYVVVTALLLYSHNDGFFVVAAQGAHQLVGFLRRRSAPEAPLRWLGMQVPVLLLYVPWSGILIEQMRRHSANFYSRSPLQLRRLAGSAVDLAGSVPLLGVVSVLAILGLVALGRERAREARGGDPRDILVLLLAWLLVPILGPLLYSVLGSPIFMTKVLLASVPPLLILVAVGVFSLGRAWMRAGVVAALVALSSAALWTEYALTNNERWRDLTRDLDARVRPGDVLLVHAPFCSEPIEYYTRRSDLELHRFPDKPEDGVEQADLPALHALIDGRSTVWLVTSHSADPAGLIAGELSRTFHLVEEVRYASIPHHRTHEFVDMTLSRFER